MFSNFYKTLLFLFIAILLLPIKLSANPQSLGYSSLKSQTESLLATGDLVTAIPYLEELINRTEALTDDSKRQPLEAMFFFAGRGYMMKFGSSVQKEDLKKALEYFERYEKEFKKEQRFVQVLISRADTYRAMGDFKKALEPLEELITKRNRPYRYTEEEYQSTLEKIVQAYYFLQDYNGGEPWFRKLLEESPDPQEKTRAAAALVESYLKQGKIDETLNLLPILLTESPSRYSLGLNVALLKAGNEMREAGNYNEASLFYSLTLTPDQMIAYNDKRIKKLQKELAYFKDKRRQEKIEELEIEIFNTEQTNQSLKEVESYGPDLEILKARVYFDTGRIWEAFYAHKGIITKYPEHEAVEDFIFATIHGANQIEKPELALEIGQNYLENPKWQKFRQDVVMMMLQVYLQKEDYESFFELGKTFVEQFSDKEEGSVVIYLLGSTWLNLNEISTLIENFQGYIKRYPNAPWLDGCYYWVGLASIYQGNFEQGKKYFEPLVKNYPYSGYHEDGMYRYAVCIYGSGDVDGGIIAFNNFIDKYSTGNLRGESEYFLGQIYASKGELETAVEHYSQVDFYAETPDYVKNAYFERGKLFHKNKMYERMAQVYKDYLDKYPDSEFFTDAVYELGRAKELLGRPGEMQKDYMDAIISYGNYPDSKGVDKLLEVFVNKYYKLRNHLEESIAFIERCLNEDEFCEKFIQDKGHLYEFFLENPHIDRKIEERFRTDSAFESLDSAQKSLRDMLTEYQEQYDIFPKTTPEDLFKPAFEKANKKGEFTLAYRLQMALEKRGIFVNRSKVFTRDDFQFASPKLLVWMAQKSANSDPEMAKEAVNIVLDQYPESSAILPAYTLMAEVYDNAKNYDRAIYFYEKLSEQFYDKPEAPVAVIKIGDILRKQRQFDEAREKYQLIIKTPSWKTGESYAQALYHIGLSYFDEGKFPEAHGFFERVFVGHSYYIDWAIQAYMMDAKALKEMGRLQDAMKTLKECLDKDSYKESEYYLKAQELLNTL